MKKLIALAALAALVGCSNNGTTSNVGAVSNPNNPGGILVPSGTFVQIERFGRPLTKEVFQMFKNHDATNRNSPPNIAGDAQLSSEINSFTSTFRAPAYGATLASILIPDEMVSDLGQLGVSPAAYLGVETGGATGGKFGGRKFADNIVDISLGVVFGKTLSALGLVPDDGKSTPCLTTDNVPPASRNQASNTFPYLQAPS